MYRLPSLDEFKKLIRLPISHPLLLLGTGDREMLRSRINQGRWKSIMREKLTRCDRALKEPIPQLPRSLYDDFFRTGRRYPFEQLYFQRRQTAEDLALGYILTGKPEYLDRCRDYIWAIMEEFTWILPAHARVPFRPDVVTEVDLFSSGTALLLADLWDLLYHDLDDETLRWMRHNVIHRVLIPLRDHYDEQWWTKRYESNWCGVCCGNSGCALILMALDEPWALDLLYRLLRSIDGFLSTADPDGAWVEGVGYYFYGFSRVVYLSDLLAKITNGHLDLLQDPRIKASATFPVWMYLPPRSQVNFGDTSGVPSVYPEVLKLFQDRYQDNSISWYVQRLEEEGLLGGGSLRDLLWASADDLKPSSQPSPPIETSKWYRQIGVIITRSSWNDLDAPILAVKAGHNGEPHNHLDVGQFIYHCYGNTFICDLGVGIYDRDYFGPKRYENPICGAEGHNLIFIDGKSQVPGRQYEGRIIEYHREVEWEKIKVDLTSAYPGELLSEATRTLYFFKLEGLVVIDEVKCRKGAVVESRLHIRGKPKLTQSGVEITAGNGRILVAPEESLQIKLEIASHKGLKTRDPELVNAQYIRLLTEATEGYAKIEVYIVPYRAGEEFETKLKTLKAHLDRVA